MPIIPPLRDRLLELPNEGRPPGPSVGATVGGKVRRTNVGWIDGDAEGSILSVGTNDGGSLTEGAPEGEILGVMDGSLLTDGASLGCFETEGAAETVGKLVGDIDGR